jgi:hypothetical protein
MWQARGGRPRRKVEMAALTLIIGSIALFAGAFASWYTVWHLRIESRFERIPVAEGRSAHVLREGVSLGDNGL